MGLSPLVRGGKGGVWTNAKLYAKRPWVERLGRGGGLRAIFGQRRVASTRKWDCPLGLTKSVKSRGGGGRIFFRRTGKIGLDAKR